MSIPPDFIYDLTSNDKSLYSSDFFELELLRLVKENTDTITEIKNEQTSNPIFTNNKKADKKANKSFKITVIKKNKSFQNTYSTHSFNITKIEKSDGPDKKTRK